jgi:adenine-specific DNA-methyltransferase
MPTLDWIGKKAVVNHHREVPFHLLEAVPELSCGDKDSGNMLIQGDNLVALKALLPYYAGKVKCIYIDPPYNTGNESWVYNDNVNDPQMLDWLGKTVGKEAEDLSRHDKWLCMMYPRLRILRELLSDDGIIFVNIDDNEDVNLKCLLNEIFGMNNFIANVIWQKRISPDARANLSPAHDYIYVYSKKKYNNNELLNLIPLSEERSKNYKNLDSDPRGAWASVDLTGQTGHATAEQFYEITSPSGVKFSPPSGRCWAMAERTVKKLIEENRIWFGKSGKSRPRFKKFILESKGTTVWTIWPNNEVGHNQEARKEVNVIFGADEAFETPKPERLIQRILQLATNKGDLVLDSFLGSGTTCAVAQKMGRRFIGVEMGEHCETHCVPRLNKVTEGEQGGISNAVGWKGGGGFRYYRLGKPLFDESGKVYEGVTFTQLARHVYFTETGNPLDTEKCETPLIGIHNENAVYLLFNGILKDKRANSGNVLTRKLLACLPEHDGTKVIYGTACRLSPVTLREQNIIFKQIPYDIKVD